MVNYQLLEPVNKTSLESASELVSLLTVKKNDWVRIDIHRRINYLRQCIQGVRSVASPWVETVCYSKGINPNDLLAGEEWMSGIMMIQRYLRLLIKALEANGQPRPQQWRTLATGQQAAQVLPINRMEKLMWPGFTAEVWIEPDKPATQGLIYREPQTSGKLCLLLGAGNSSGVCPINILYKLFIENQTVILKMNPVNDYEGPFIEQAFQALIKDGFLKIVYGNADLGSYLCHHTAIDTVHITGSEHTHDVIVWGSTPEEQAKRKQEKTPLLKKSITSELGCVTPVFVVPGSWSSEDLAYQAQHVASMVAHNASFNCDAAKVVVVADGWNQREAFLEQLHQALANLPARKAYYPGAQQRYQSILKQYPQARPLVLSDEESIPWTVIPDVPPRPGEYALTHEAFCGVLAEVTLSAANAKDFLAQIVPFANQTIKGTLSCILLIDPATEKACAAELDQTIADLRYGTVAVNVWSAIGCSFGSTTWGAFPGNALEDIGSGQGVIHNAFLFDYPQKSVIRAPFRMKVTPGWFATHKNLLQLSKRLSAFEADPHWNRMPGIVLAALKG